MTYYKTHQSSDCDKCLKRVGKSNLIKVPFLYLDKNDKVHKDMSPAMRKHEANRIGEIFGNTFQAYYLISKICVIDGYRQYFVCKECWEKGV